MAEETVKRVTGINPLLLAVSNLTAAGVPSVNVPVDASTNTAVSMQQSPNQLFHQAVPGITTAVPHHQRLDGSFHGSTSIPLVGNLKNDVAPQSDVGGNKLPSIHPMSRLANMQKQLAPGTSPGEAVPGWGPEVAKNNKQNHNNM